VIQPENCDFTSEYHRKTPSSFSVRITP